MVAKGRGTAAPATWWSTCGSTTTPTRWSSWRRLLDLHTLYFDKADPADLLTLAGDARPTRSAPGWPRSGTRAPTAGLDAALADWAGIENLEERMVAGRIDPLVLAHLRGLD